MVFILTVAFAARQNILKKSPIKNKMPSVNKVVKIILGTNNHIPVNYLHLQLSGKRNRGVETIKMAGNSYTTRKKF